MFLSNVRLSPAVFLRLQQNNTDSKTKPVRITTSWS